MAHSIMICVSLVIAVSLLQVSRVQGDSPSVSATLQWPQNDNARAGAIVKLAYSDVGTGSCLVKLPAMVNLFHLLNAHVVAGEYSNPVEGKYKIAAPASWQAENGVINVLIFFDWDTVFEIDDIDMKCDPDDVEKILVNSFPQNNLMKEASSSVFYRPGFHVGDYLMIQLPSPVKSFNFTTMDSAYVVETDGRNLYALTGFKNPVGVDDMKEVHFSLIYNDSKDSRTNWFSAADITVNIVNLSKNTLVIL